MIIMTREGKKKLPVMLPKCYLFFYQRLDRIGKNHLQYGMSAVIPPTDNAVLTLAGLRNKTGLTVRQVGERIGLTHPRIVQIEGEGTKDMDQLEALAAIYGVSFDEIRVANSLTKSR